MESCLPAKHHYFSVGKLRSSLFIREEEVLLEEDFATPQQQKEVRKQSKQSSKQTPATQQYINVETVASNEPLNVNDPSKLAQQLGVNQTQFMKEQSDILQKAAKEKEREDIKAAIPDESLNMQGQERMLQQFSEKKKKEDKRKMSDSHLTRREDHVYDNADILAQPSVPARQPFHDPEHHLGHGQHPASHPSSSYHSGEAPPVQYPASHPQAQYQPPPNSNYANMLPQDMEHPPPQHHHQYYPSSTNMLPVTNQDMEHPPPQHHHQYYPSSTNMLPVTNQDMEHPFPHHHHQYYPAGSSSTMNTQQPSIQSGQHKAYAAPPDQTYSAGLGVGSPVQLIQDPNRTGVIKWIGPLSEIKGTIAGVELVSMRENYIIIIMIVLFLSSGWSYGRL